MEAVMNPETSSEDLAPYAVAPDIAGMKVVFVNVYFVGDPVAGSKWVLVDAALPNSAARIKREAERLFGENNPPAAIVLTHGHFDHVGALPDLLKEWPNVPVYAHPLEMPFLQGKSHYPPPDPGVGGGAMAYMSWMFPTGPSNLGDQVQPFPADGTIPEMPGWHVVHTPGHSPGHVSLFRASDRALLAGDAFTTTRQESAIAVITQKEELHGPPTYFTIDWEAARRSIQTLAALNPTAAGAGHGKAIRSITLPQHLDTLLQHFNETEVPKGGRYVKQPAHTDEEGIVDMPTPVSYHVARAIGIGLIVGTVMWAFGGSRKR
ncbi:MBL fold metallo-hydrolase [Tellurirhabdus bombi]|uniref:MBL fold metallo-hydrolase n=1 Tax=Tellurirhabdus bombi TaxID=2907205 RepID=UPI001F46535A|nr:MBL fold metallo-hydrolase [Tellurirhabdus bombi]